MPYALRAALTLAAMMIVATTGHAQSVNERTDGGSETYHAEISAGVWSASPDGAFSSGTLGIGSSDINIAGDLGLIRKRLPQIRLVLKPAPRHKIRIGYLPTSFESDTTLRRTISFGRTNFTIGIPVTASLSVQTWRFGYEYDLLAGDKWFVGAIGEVRYARVSADLSSGFLGVESSLANALIPAVGGVGRIYLHPRVALTAEAAWFHIPELLDGLAGAGRSVDFDASGIVTLTRNVGIQIGYRTFDVSYRSHEDEGTVGLRGVYLSSVIRF